MNVYFRAALRWDSPVREGWLHDVRIYAHILAQERPRVFRSRESLRKKVLESLAQKNGNQIAKEASEVGRGDGFTQGFMPMRLKS